MKDFFQDKHKMTSFTTIAGLLIIMAGISYYYLQFDSESIRWVLLFSNLFLAVSGIGVLLHGTFTKDIDVLLLGVEFTILGLVSFAAKLFSILNLSTVGTILDLSAVALSTVFLFSVIDRLTFQKRLISKWWFVVIMVVLAVIPTVLSLIFTQQIYMMITYSAFTLLFAVAFALALINIIKGQHLFFSWSYLCFAVTNLATYILHLFSNNIASKLVCVSEIAIAFVLISAISINYNPTVKKQKKIVHKN